MMYYVCRCQILHHFLCLMWLFLRADPKSYPLPVELQERIYRYLPLRDLISLSAIPNLKDDMEKHLEARILRLLVSFRLKGKDTLDMMRSTGTVVSGSAALEIVSPGSCEPRDLNLYCPAGSAQGAIRMILGLDGFVESPYPLKTLLAERTPFSRFEVNNGIKRLYRFVHLPSSKVVTLAESISTSSVAPVLFFHSTLLMNYVSGSGVVSFYPELTYDNLGLLNYSQHFDELHKPGVLDRWEHVGMDICHDCRDWHQDHPSLSPSARRGMCQWAYRQTNDEWTDRMDFRTGQRKRLGPILAWRLGHVYKGRKDVMYHKTSVHLVHEEWFKLCLYKTAVEWVRYYAPIDSATGEIDSANWKRSFPQ
ncbi:hypothetical protein DFP72DRAFT_918342 [Ephemerocybe angulata]|uniref:F-box domain-containing protein n=1 Tax=Ephemerocybe angulata TaxID=980116 RepID=A0A8H6HLB6_9AGAR|nr:hypothetical protein DFP72DRAFT_918342 [Tulosesus angulatus]